MARKTFFSFHYKPDNWRASQVRNMGALEGNPPVSDNDWEKVEAGGDATIKAWILAQMNGRSCAVVIIGESTAGRKWINYEIVEAWQKGMGVFGIYIHGLQNISGEQCQKGGNPFDSISYGDKKLSAIVKAYNPPYSSSTDVYNYIKQNIASWADEAVEIRKKH